MSIKKKIGSNLTQNGVRSLLFAFLAILSGYLIVSVLAVPRQGSRQDTAPPTRPRGVQAAAVSSERVEVYWIASVDDVGVAGYGIYRCPGDCRSWPWPGSFVWVGTSTSAASFVDTTVRPDTEYTYLVTAFDAAGNESGPGRPPTTGGFRPLMHDHQPHTLPVGHTARVDVTYPSSVRPGETFRIRRVLILSPSITIGHADLHYRTDNDDSYRQWGFPRRSIKEDGTVTVTAPTTPGNIFLYAETHLSWSGIVGTDQSPFCSPWFRIVVTNGNPLDVRPASLPEGAVGMPYAQDLTADGEISGSFRWGITHGGSLPPGLAIASRTGTIGGIPRRTGTYSFTAVVEADSGAIASRKFTLTIQ